MRNPYSWDGLLWSPASNKSQVTLRTFSHEARTLKKLRSYMRASAQQSIRAFIPRLIVSINWLPHKIGELVRQS